MNKAELVIAIAEKTQMTKKDSEAALVAALDAITAAWLKVSACSWWALAPLR